MKKTEQKIYCGPTIPGVIKENTAFTGESIGLKKVMERCPAIISMIVDTDRFAGMRKACMTEGSPENILYKKLQKEIGEGKAYV